MSQILKTWNTLLILWIFDLLDFHAVELSFSQALVPILGSISMLMQFIDASALTSLAILILMTHTLYLILISNIELLGFPHWVWNVQVLFQIGW